MHVVRDLSKFEIPEGEFWYLSSPYTKYKFGLAVATRIVSRVAGRLFAARLPFFAPIPHSHTIAELGKVDALDHEAWMHLDRPLMLAAYGLIVVRMSGWQDSTGIGEEIDYFTAAGKPIEYLDPIPEDLKP